MFRSKSYGAVGICLTLLLCALADMTGCGHKQAADEIVVYWR